MGNGIQCKKYHELKIGEWTYKLGQNIISIEKDVCGNTGQLIIRETYR